MSNFLVIALGDNDFGSGLWRAAQTLLDHGLDQQPERVPQIRDVVIAALQYQSMLENALAREPLLEYFDRNMAYFEKRLKVSFEAQAPSIDHDGGSLYIDVHTREVCRY